MIADILDVALKIQPHELDDIVLFFLSLPSCLSNVPGLTSTITRMMSGKALFRPSTKCVFPFQTHYLE